MARRTWADSTPVNTTTLSEFTQDEDLKPSSENFAGTTGTTITHNYGHQNYHVTITPTEDPAGYLGEVYIVKADNTAVVYNTGSATGTFDYLITPHA
ncbi:MAG: hypothetical protein WC322_02360 [Candidatus Paceibacterota bacterium]|jgi:hypothetical protein